DLAAQGYTPEYWKAEDSALIFCLLNFGQSANLQEEINALGLAQKVGSDKLPWLTPSYPDEPLPLAEADKLKGLNLTVPGLNEVSRAINRLA
ncbi:penicillin acylase family protein, partial [Pseudoalteromonas sp. SIMBA_162]